MLYVIAVTSTITAAAVLDVARTLRRHSQGRRTGQFRFGRPWQRDWWTD